MKLNNIVLILCLISIDGIVCMEGQNNVQNTAIHILPHELMCHIFKNIIAKDTTLHGSRSLGPGSASGIYESEYQVVINFKSFAAVCKDWRLIAHTEIQRFPETAYYLEKEQIIRVFGGHSTEGIKRLQMLSDKLTPVTKVLLGLPY